MALSVIVVPGDGVTTQFSIPFALGYINQSDITCRVGTEVDGLGNPLYRTLTFMTADTVQVSGTPAGVGVPVTFRRTVTRNQLLVDWENGTVMEETNMNIAQKQALMLVHEVLDGQFDQFQNDINMNGFQMYNLGYPTVDSQAASKKYVDDVVDDVVTIMSGGSVISVAGLQGIVGAPALKTALDISTVTSSGLAGKLAKSANLSDVGDLASAQNNLQVYAKSYIDTALGNLNTLINTLVPIGMPLWWPKDTVPNSNFLILDGTVRNISAYPALGAVYGAMYGGDGTTTFGVPDMRGLVPRGLDLGRGIDPGRWVGTYQADTVGPHNHTTGSSVSTIAAAVGLNVLQSWSDGTTTGTHNPWGETRMKNMAWLPIVRAL